MTVVTIGGEQRTIAEFSAFKALHAMAVIKQVEEKVRELILGAGAFRDEYAKAHFTRMTRAEAKRNFPPQPLYEQRANDRGEVETLLVLIDGEPKLRPGKLDHLTEEDWAAAGHELIAPEYPSDEMVQAMMVTSAFEIARTHVLRLLALALVANRDLRKWEEDGDDLDAKLDEEAKTLVYDCTAPELLELTVSVIGAVKDQISGPFGDARAALQEVFRPAQGATPAGEVTPSPMTVEREEPTTDQEDAGSGETASSPTSSTSSPDATDGATPSASTVPAGASSAV